MLYKGLVLDDLHFKAICGPYAGIHVSVIDGVLKCTKMQEKFSISYMNTHEAHTRQCFLVCLVLQNVVSDRNNTDFSKKYEYFS